MLINKNKLPNKLFFHFNKCISKDYIIFVFADDLWCQELPRWLGGKGSTWQSRSYRRVPWGRKWQPTAGFLLEKFHGQRNLMGYSPWGHKESDMLNKIFLRKIFNPSSVISNDKIQNSKFYTKTMIFKTLISWIFLKIPFKVAMI